MKKSIAILLGFILFGVAYGIGETKGKTISGVKCPRADVHFSSGGVELASDQLLAILNYKSDKRGVFSMSKKLIWKGLSMQSDGKQPLARCYGWSPLNSITFNGCQAKIKKLTNLSFNGVFKAEANIAMGRKGHFKLEYTSFPSVDLPSFIEIYKITNIDDKSLCIEIPEGGFMAKTESKPGAVGSGFIIMAGIQSADYQLPIAIKLAQGESFTFSSFITAAHQGCRIDFPNAEKELAKRLAAVGMQK